MTAIVLGASCTLSSNWCKVLSVGQFQIPSLVQFEWFLPMLVGSLFSQDSSVLWSIVIFLYLFVKWNILGFRVSKRIFPKIEPNISGLGPIFLDKLIPNPTHPTFIRIFSFDLFFKMILKLNFKRFRFCWIFYVPKVFPLSLQKVLLMFS
jgi:hypothetical protein